MFFLRRLGDVTCMFSRPDSQESLSAIKKLSQLDKNLDKSDCCIVQSAFARKTAIDRAPIHGVIDSCFAVVNFGCSTFWAIPFHSEPTVWTGNWKKGRKSLRLRL